MKQNKDSLAVTVRELRAAADAVLSHLETLGMINVDLDVDYYWSVEDSRLYDPYQSPGELSLDQVSADLEDLRRIVREGGEPLTYGLTCLASVLRAVAHQIEVR